MVHIFRHFFDFFNVSPFCTISRSFFVQKIQKQHLYLFPFYNILCYNVKTQNRFTIGGTYEKI